jgi:hypothetical protein
MIFSLQNNDSLPEFPTAVAAYLAGRVGNGELFNEVYVASADQSKMQVIPVRNTLLAAGDLLPNTISITQADIIAAATEWGMPLANEMVIS